MRDLLLVNGLLADGSGSPLHRADILLRGGKIEAISPGEIPGEAEVLNCAGLVVAPGFIDAHSHSDLQVLQKRKEKLHQGVTSEIVGNCGFSPYPCGQHAAELRAFANGIFCGDDSWGWPDAESYLASLRAHATLGSIGSLIGHGSLRIAVCGNRMGPVTPKELDKMECLLDESLAAGATGFSTGLMYAPGSSADVEELDRLCRVVTRRNKVYCTHMRDYGRYLLEAVEEQIVLARRTGCRLQISHLQAVGKSNRSLNGRALERIEAAHKEGIDLAFDCYPYIAGSTVMTQLLPQHALDGGTAALMERLKDRQLRKQLREETLAGIVHEWDELYISAVGSSVNADAVGKNLKEIAELRGCNPIEAMFDLLLEEEGEVNILEFNQSQENLQRNITHPLSIVISDGFYVKGRPHPRLYGTFAELLGTLCREKQWLPLETAIYKITGFPAERFRLQDRGYLRSGYAADVVAFDPASIESRATYDSPEHSPIGIHYVIRQGQLLLPESYQAA